VEEDALLVSPGGDDSIGTEVVVVVLVVVVACWVDPVTMTREPMPRCPALVVPVATTGLGATGVLLSRPSGASTVVTATGRSPLGVGATGW
jgi:hypothetical protein